MAVSWANRRGWLANNCLHLPTWILARFGCNCGGCNPIFVFVLDVLFSRCWSIVDRKYLGASTRIAPREEPGEMRNACNAFAAEGGGGDGATGLMLVLPNLLRVTHGLEGPSNFRRFVRNSLR